MSKKESSKNDTQSRNKKDSNKSGKSINNESQGLRAVREREIIDLLNHENMLRYLKGLTQSNDAEELVNKVSDAAIENVGLSLERGMLQISLNPQPLPLKSQIIGRKSPQELRELQVKAKREELQRKMDYLNQQTRGDVVKIEVHEHAQIKEVLTKEEHERKIKIFMEDWSEHRHRQEEQLQQLQRRQREEKQQKEELQAVQIKKQAQAKRLQIEENIKQRKLQHEQFLKQQQQLKKQQLAANLKGLYESKMQRHSQSEAVLSLLQQKKNRLKQVRDFNSLYSSQAIKEHEKQYLSTRNISHSEKKMEEVKWQAPARSKKLARLLQLEQLQLKQKIQGRQKRSEQRLQREEDFMHHLRAKHMPTVDPQKKGEIQSRLQEETKKKEKPIVDAKQLRQLGKEYLKMSKKLIKPENLRNSEIKSKTTEEKERTSRVQNFLLPRNRSPEFYENERRRKIEEIINSESVATQKYQLLQIETQKVGQKLRQQELLGRIRGDEQDNGELLYSSIKAKMGLVQLLHKQSTQ